jgi:hypothetical protein
VQERAAHVQALAAPSREHERGDDVDGDPGERDDEDDAPLDLRGVDEPLDRLEEDPRTDQRERRAVDLRRQHADAAEAEGPASGRGPVRDRGGAERQAERGGVREHVPRVREQRERPGDEAEDDLRREQAEDQRKGNGERAAAGVRAMVVTVVHAPRVMRSTLLR